MEMKIDAFGGELAMDDGQWRNQMLPESRQRIVRKITDTLKKHLPYTNQDGDIELQKIASRFEEKTFSTAENQPDYLKKISLKMLTVENKSQNSTSNSLPSSGNNSNPMDVGVLAHSLHSQIAANANQGQSHVGMLSANQSQARPQLPSENLQNNLTSLGVQSNAGLQPALSSVSGLTQPTIPSVLGQGQNTISGVQQSQVAQGMPSDIFASSLRQIPGRQQVAPQQQQASNSQQFLYQQHLQQQLLKQKLQQGSLHHTLVQSHMQQQQQQNLLQASQLQASQPSMPSVSVSGIQQNQLSQQNAQPALRQQQQQQLLGQSGSMSLQQNQLGGQNNLQNLIAQQSSLSSIHQQQLGQQSNLRQQPKGSVQQQLQQNAMNLIPAQGQQAQPQLQQQQMMSQIHSQPSQLQQQLGLQQRIPLSGHPSGSSLLQAHNVFDQQKQLYQSQRALAETSSPSLDSTAQGGHANGGDWQEDIYQKLKAMKELYLSDLNEIYQRITAKLHQVDSLPLQSKSDQIDKLKMYQTMVERMLSALQIPKNSILPNLKEKLPSYEKQIVNFLNTHRPRKLVPSLQQQQHLPQPHIQPVQQQQQSQISQIHPLDSQMNAQLQQNSLSSLPGVSTARQNMMASLQPCSNSMEPGQGNGLSSLQQQNAPLRSSSSLLHHQHLKQAQEHQLKQQRQLHHQLLQQQQQQQVPQQGKQQFLGAGQMQAHQMGQASLAGDINEQKIRPVLGVKQAVLQHLPANQRTAYPQQQMKLGASFHASSAQMLQVPSPQVTQQAHASSAITKAMNSPLVIPSPPAAPSAPSPLHGDSEKPSSVAANVGSMGQQQAGGQAPPASSSLAIATPGMSASPLLVEATGNGDVPVIGQTKPTVSEKPIDHLIRVIKSISPEALASAVNDIRAVVSLSDRFASSCAGNGSRAAIGEDLAAVTKSRLHARSFITQDGVTEARKKRCHVAVPLNDAASNGTASDPFWKSASWTPELESTATSNAKKACLEANNALVEEIREINQSLVETVVAISAEEDDPVVTTSDEGEDAIVTCSYKAVAVSPELKSELAAEGLIPVPPLKVLVPSDYPRCSPIILDTVPVEVGKEGADFVAKVKSSFSHSLRCLSQPISLGEIVHTWDQSARALVVDYAQKKAGGICNSFFGTWEKIASSADRRHS